MLCALHPFGLQLWTRINGESGDRVDVCGAAGARHLGVECRERGKPPCASQSLGLLTKGIAVRALPFSLLMGALLATLMWGARVPLRPTPFQEQAAQKAEEAAEAAAGDELPSGTTICAELAKPVNAKKAHVGDEVVARVTLPVLARGHVLLANGAKIVGHVTEAMARSRRNPTSRLGILFDHAELKDGTLIPMSLTVQAIGLSTLAAAVRASMDQDDPDAPEPNRQTTPPPISGRRGVPQVPAPQPPEPVAAESAATDYPALDVGSHGMIGLPDLSLAESSKTAAGSVVTSTKKTVKLDSLTQFVLRVVAP